MGYTAQKTLRIADYLSAGHDRAITQRNLEAILHIPGRTIRHMIETERRAGVPICSDNRAGGAGYYLAADETELAQFVGSMRRRAEQILQTAAAVEEGAET